MSLILEALRKSEAERARAQVPGLHAPVPARPIVRRVAPAWGPWVAVLVGAALLGGTWWVNRPTSAAAPVPVRPATPPVAPAPSPSPAPVVQAPAPVVAAPAPRVPDPPHIKPTPIEHGDPIVEPLPTPVATMPEPVAPAPDPDPVATPPDALPTLASLSPTDREALPPLKVSMFVWSPEPARRFAIVDGNRVGEGALLAGGTVVEIRPDGVVLQLQGRRVLLARP